MGLFEDGGEAGVAEDGGYAAGTEAAYDDRVFIDHEAFETPSQKDGGDLLAGLVEAADDSVVHESFGRWQDG